MSVATAQASPYVALAERLADYIHDPLGYARVAYGWGEGELADSAGPRKWQADILFKIGRHFQQKLTRYHPLRIAVAKGHGIGGSALLAMLTDWAMSTCPGCKVVVTANTGTQLATKTVPEFHKWLRLSISAALWDLKATSITSRVPDYDRLWRTDFIPWTEQNPEAFAGLHNQRKRILVIFDEASAIPEIIWQTVEGALTDEDTEIIFLAFGNPTQNTGPFRECFGRMKHRWMTFQVDSRTVEGTNKSQIAQWATDYGEDSDFVRVRVRGEFPRAGSTQFIGSDVVAACRKFKAEGFSALPKILSVDVARFGDDESVIGVRQGRQARILGSYRGLDTVELAQRVIEWRQKEQPDAIVVDGDGIGAGVVDQIKHRGFEQRLFEFHGAAKPNNPEKYFNRRAEVWGEMRDWLAAGAEIPDDPALEIDLTAPEYGFSAKQQIQLEKKDDMKRRGLNSPDRADMLAMTFGVTLAPPKKKDLRPLMLTVGESDLGWLT